MPCTPGALASLGLGFGAMLFPILLRGLRHGAKPLLHCMLELRVVRLWSMEAAKELAWESQRPVQLKTGRACRCNADLHNEMGNVLAQPLSKAQPAILGDLPVVTLKDTLGASFQLGCMPLQESCHITGTVAQILTLVLPGGGRFLKTLLCVHDEGGLVVVKV